MCPVLAFGGVLLFVGVARYVDLRRWQAFGFLCLASALSRVSLRQQVFGFLCLRPLFHATRFT